MATSKLHLNPDNTLTAKLPSYDAILYSICQEEGIKFQLLSRNWVKRLEKAGQVHYIVGYKFSLNSSSASLVADDKYATYSTLQYQDIPAVEHETLYDFTNHEPYAIGHNSYDAVGQYFEQHNHHIVIKPACGTGGKQVHQVTDLKQIPTVLTDVFYNNATACLCPFYHIKHEYRIILLDGEVKLAYMKTLQDSHNWKFNLQQGAISEPISDSIYPTVVELAKRAARALDLRFCSIDIIHDTNDQLLILEANSGVMIRYYLVQHPEQLDTVKEIYRSAIKKMFADIAR